MTALREKIIAKAMASALMLLVLCMSFPINAFAAVAVDLKANGQDALTLGSASETFSVALASTGATACQLTSPEASGVSVDMTSTIAPGHPWYPAAGSSVTFTVTCTDGTSTQSDSVVVSLGSGTTGGGGSGAVTVDIKANGSDGPVTLTAGTPFTYSWTSTGATACQLTSPEASGISVSGTSSSIASGHPWYPTSSAATTLTITCTNGTTTATDSVVVSLAGTTGGAVTADIKANGSDGPVVTITPGSSYTYSWSSAGATACQLTSPETSGISTSGSSSAITPSHPWYPTAGNNKTLTIVCTNGVTTATDSVTVALGSTSGTGSSVSVDVKINGSDGPVSVINGTIWTYTWTSAGATACQQTSPEASGISTSGTSSTIVPGHPWYPAIGGSTTITVTCTNGTNTATDSAVINVITQSSGGGSSSGPFGTVLPPTTTGASCLFVRDYMRADFRNDPIEVMKLQSFLRVFEGNTSVTINGIYDQATVNAVNAFQMKYRADILDPWGHKAPTGYTYILTLKKVNELYCLHTFPLNEAQIQEIAAFRALITGLRAQGIDVDYPTVPAAGVGGSRTITVPVTHTETVETGGATTTATSTTVTIPVVGVSTSTDAKGQNSATLAAVLFAAPANVMDGLQCIYEFLLVLIVLYILGSVLEDVLYRKEDATKARARFYAKWTTIALGLIVAMIVAYNVGEWCLMLPLLIALILSLIWMALYPKHSGTPKGAKAWIMASGAQAKNTIKETTTTETTTVVEKKA